MPGTTRTLLNRHTQFAPDCAAKRSAGTSDMTKGAGFYRSSVPSLVGCHVSTKPEVRPCRKYSKSFRTPVPLQRRSPVSWAYVPCNIVRPSCRPKQGTEPLAPCGRLWKIFPV
jgi:hypothetical protein